MPYSQWSNLDARYVGGVRSGNSGIMPVALTPASQIAFRYSYQLDFTDIIGGSTGFSAPVTVSATVRVTDSSGANVLLEWTFTDRYLVAQDEFTFTWYSEATTVTTAAPTPAPKILGSPDGIDIPGGGSAASGADIIFDTFETPIFVVAIPPGAIVQITFHTAGFPYLNDILSLQVQTRPGGSWASGYRHAVDGEAVVIYPGAAGVQQARLPGRADALVLDAPFSWTADGESVLLRSPGGSSPVILAPSGGDITARYALANSGAAYGDPVTIYPGKTLIAAAEQGGTITVLMTDSTGAAFFGTGNRTGTWSDPQAATLPAGTTLSPGQMLAGSGSLILLYAGASGIETLTSTTAGAIWE